MEENVADALKTAGFVLLFVVALSIAMITFTKARATSEDIIYAKDNKNDYTYVEEIQYKTSREVKMDTIIPTLYRYYTEQYKIEFYDTSGSKILLYRVANTPNTKKWRDKHTDEDRNINYFDLDDEMERNELWQGSRQATKEFVDKMIQGPLNTYKDRTFKEELGEYTFERDDSATSGNSTLTDAIESHKQKKRVIRYTLMN